MNKVVIDLGIVASLVFGVALAHAANDSSVTMPEGNTKQSDFYNTYERKGGTQVPVNSAKDAAEPGKVLKQDRLKTKEMTHPGERKIDGA